MTRHSYNDPRPAYRLADGDLAAVICPGCGAHVQGHGRGTGKTFHDDKCRQRFSNRMKAEGGPMAALVKAWVMTRHAKPDTEEAEVCRFARSQLTQIAATFNDRDQDEDRPSAVQYVKTLMRSGTLYCDRARDPKRQADPADPNQPTIMDHLAEIEATTR